MDSQDYVVVDDDALDQLSPASLMLIAQQVGVLVEEEKVDVEAIRARLKRNELPS